MPDLPEETRWRVKWWSKHESGHVHANSHEHSDEDAARQDYAACQKYPHIVSATLTRIVTSSTEVIGFDREGQEIGGALVSRSGGDAAS